MAHALSGKMSPSAEGALWGIGVYGAVFALYMLFKPEPGTTQAADMPSAEGPTSFGNLGAVASRFDEVKTLYRAGRFTPQQTLDEVDRLTGQVAALRSAGVAPAGDADRLLTTMGEFANDVVEFMEIQPATSAVA